MGKEKTTSQENVKKKKNLLSYRTLIVFAILVVYALVTFISLRADYLEFKGIDDNFIYELKKLGYITINSSANSSPYILNFSYHNLYSETLMHYFEEHDIYVSISSIFEPSRT